VHVNSSHVLLATYHSGDQIRKNKMGQACGTYGETGEVYTGSWWGHLRERDHLEDVGIDGRIILK
jgi:hypothetical protein